MFHVVGLQYTIYIDIRGEILTEDFKPSNGLTNSNWCTTKLNYEIIPFRAGYLTGIM